MTDTSGVTPADDVPAHARGSRLADFTKNGGLLPAEENLRHACMRGETCTIGNGTRPDISTRDNTIRASFLRYLILGGCEDTPLHQRGVRLEGAYIACRHTEEFGKCLDLQATNIRLEVSLENCQIDGSVLLFSSQSKTLNFDGSGLHSLGGDRLVATGSIYMRDGFTSKGPVKFIGSTVSGDFSCRSGVFADTAESLICDRMEVGGGVFLNGGFHAEGAVCFPGAKISDNLDCSDGLFAHSDIALNCDGMKCGGDAFFSDTFKAVGAIRLLGSELKGDLACRGGTLKNGIDASNTVIRGNVFLDEGFSCHQTVSLPNAEISGNIDTTNANFFSNKLAIHANKATIKGNVILGEIDTAGTLAFQSATIHGDFSANGAILSGKPCVDLRNADIRGTLHWRDIKHANGRLNLGGAKAKTVNMDIESWQKPASVKLNNFDYLGFESLEESANSSYWKSFLACQPGRDLTTRFRPRPFEHLASVLDTMGYEEEARSIRIERQRLQTDFMANHDPDRNIETADGEERMRWLHFLNIFFRRFVSGPLVDYGYRPGKAFLFLIALILIGSGVYWKAANLGIMTPTHPLIFKEAEGGFIPEKCANNWVYFPELSAEDVKDDPKQRTRCEEFMPSEYSEFQSLIYAADIALPIVNLRMESDWSPRVVYPDGERHWAGWWVRTFEWFLIISGWLLSLLFVSAVGGIIRR